ncbi:hypothetical protein MbovBow_04095 [Mycoplasmopsis bovis]
MKESLILATTSMVALLPIATVSCKIFVVEKNVINGGRNVKPVPKDPNHIDSFNGGDNSVDNPTVDNPNAEDENAIPTSFTFNGKKYKISREDTLDTKDAIYASTVLNNNAKEFKAMLPTFEDYKKVNHLDSENLDFPSIAKVSYYVRNLEHFKKGFPYRANEKTPTKINAEEYKKLIDTVTKIMEDSKLSITLSGKGSLNTNESLSFERVKNLTLKKVYESAKSSGAAGILWGKSKTRVSDIEPDGSTTIESYFEEIPPKNDYSELEINAPDNVLKKMPSMYWIFNRMVDNSDFYNLETKVNELFLTSEFLFKKDLDSKKYTLNIDILMLNYWLRAKRFTMQYPLWNMLTSYLKLQQALIKNQEWKEDKTLEENFKELKITKAFDNFHDAVIEYMKLGQLVGFTDEESDTELFLFPTDLNNEVKTDFRDAYRWAYLQYHKFIQPLAFAINRDNKVAFEKAFEKEELKPYYEFIWANIKAVDKLDKPRILNKDEALKEAKSIISHYKSNFNWKFKTEETSNKEDE